MVNINNNNWSSAVRLTMGGVHAVPVYKVTVTGKIAGWLLAWAGSGAPSPTNTPLSYRDISLTLPCSH